VLKAAPATADKPFSTYLIGLCIALPLIARLPQFR
jgi:hypothetical protein